ncbi:hypothetical protein QOT17_010039 [Balamuthia mandrillaris]
MSNTPSWTSTSLRTQQALLRDQLFQAILSRDLHSVQRLWQEHNNLKAIRKRIEAEERELNDEPNDSRLGEDEEEQEGTVFTEEVTDGMIIVRCRNSIEEREESEDLTALMVVMGVDSHWTKELSSFRYFMPEWNARLKINLDREGAKQSKLETTLKITQAHARTEFQLRCIDLLLSFGEGEEEEGESEELLSAKCKQSGWNVLHYAVMHRVDEEVLRSLLQRWRASPEETCAIAPWVHEDVRVFSPDKQVPPVLLAIMERNMSAYHLLLSNVEPPPGSSSMEGWNGMDQLLFNAHKEREPLLYSICGRPRWYTPSFCNEALQALHERLPQQYFELWLNCWISNWATDFPATPLILLLDLHNAARYSEKEAGVKHWEEAVKWLLQKGADPYLCAGNGNCSVAWLWDYGYRDMVEQHSIVHMRRVREYASMPAAQQKGLYLALVSSSLRASVGEEEAKRVTPATIGILWLMVNKKGTQAITFTSNGILTKWKLCSPEQKQCKEDTTSLFQPTILQSVDILSLSAEMKKSRTKQKDIFNSDQNNGEELPLFCNTRGKLALNRRMSIRWHDLTVLPFPGKGYRVTSSDRRWVLLNDTVLLRFNSALVRWTTQANVPSSCYLDKAKLTLLDWKPIRTDENDKNGTEKKKEEVTLTCVTRDAFARYVATFEVDEEEEVEEEEDDGDEGEDDGDEEEGQEDDDEKDAKKNLKWQEETIIPLLSYCGRSADVIAINERRTKLVLALVSRLECIDLRTGLQKWFLDTERNICNQRTEDGDYDSTQYPFNSFSDVTTVIIVALPRQSAEQQPYSMDRNATRKVEEPYEEEEEEEECIVVGFSDGQVAMLSLNNPGHIFSVHKLPKVTSFCARIHQPPSRTCPSVDCLVADKERGVVWAVGSGSPLIPLPLPSSASLPVGLGDVLAYEAVCFKRFHDKAKKKSPCRMPEEDSLLPYEDQNELHQSTASSISSVAALSTLCIDSLVRSLTPKSASLIQSLLPSDLNERCLRYLLSRLMTISLRPNELFTKGLVTFLPLFPHASTFTLWI